MSFSSHLGIDSMSTFLTSVAHMTNSERLLQRTTTGVRQILDRAPRSAASISTFACPWRPAESGSRSRPARGRRCSGPAPLHVRLSNHAVLAKRICAGARCLRATHILLGAYAQGDRVSVAEKAIIAGPYHSSQLRTDAGASASS